MTAFVETRKVAHVLELEDGRLWRAVCYSEFNPQRGVELTLGSALEDWPLKFVYDAQPAKPWCSRCVRIIRHRVNTYQRDVLDHAGRPS